MLDPDFPVPVLPAEAVFVDVLLVLTTPAVSVFDPTVARAAVPVSVALVSSVKIPPAVAISTI
jgi:hypothetical protein